MLLPDDLLREFLSWLPVKSLMRFKCVSRAWLLIILDPSFAKIFRGGVRGLLSCVSPGFRFKAVFFHVDLYGGNGASHQVRPHHLVDLGSSDQAKGYTNVVDGLLCFYQLSGTNLWLYNIATGEAVILPTSTTCCKGLHCGYHFGFDPIIRRYKLLKTCRCGVEILTIGRDSTWRTIGMDSFFPHIVTLVSQSVCLGGILCWFEDHDLIIIAFDLAKEKSVHIPTPLRPGEAESYDTESSFWPFMKLVNFGPSIIVTKPGRHEYGYEFGLQILRYDHGHNREQNGGGNWADAVPEQLMNPHKGPFSDIFSPTALGILPDGKMLVYDADMESFPPKLYFLNLSSGEWEMVETDSSHFFLSKEEWEVLQIDSSWDSLLCGYDRPAEVFRKWTYFEENIISLARLTSCI